jgi:hypothetical protein
MAAGGPAARMRSAAAAAAYPARALLTALLVALLLAAHPAPAAAAAPSLRRLLAEIDCGADYRMWARAKNCPPSGAQVCLLWSELGGGPPRAGCWTVRAEEQPLGLGGAPVEIDSTKPIFYTFNSGGGDPGTPTSGDPTLKYSTDRAPCDGTARGRSCCDAPRKYSAVFNCGSP